MSHSEESEAEYAAFDQIGAEFEDDRAARADDPIDQLEQRVRAEFSDSYARPNSPHADDYVRHAEAMGLQAQEIADSNVTTGAYYHVYAIYPPEPFDRFNGEPLALVFTDYSRSIWSTWICRP